MPQRLIQEIKHILYRPGIIAVPQGRQHHLAIDEMNCQEDLAAFPANDGVQLDHRSIRILVHKALKASIIPSNPAGTIHFEC